MDYQDNKCYLLATESYSLASLLFNEKKRHYNWMVIILYYSGLMYARALFELWHLEIPDVHRTKCDSNGQVIKLGWNQALEICWVRMRSMILMFYTGHLGDLDTSHSRP